MSSGIVRRAASSKSATKGAVRQASTTTATESRAPWSSSNSSPSPYPNASAALLTGPIPLKSARRPKVATTTGGKTQGKNAAAASAPRPKKGLEQERQTKTGQKGEAPA